MAYFYINNDKDCFNRGCPFRTNNTSSANRCECADACPNRAYITNTFSSNRTIPLSNPMTSNTTEKRSSDESRD